MFVNNGFEYIGNIDGSFADQLGKQIFKNINIENLFIENKKDSEKYLDIKTNPMPGRNMAEKMQISKFFENEAITKSFKRICGERYRILDYKFVLGVPTTYMPGWVRDELGGKAQANLGKYIKPDKRLMTYFNGLDFHQDIIDFPSRNPDFATFYYYLTNVTTKESPLVVLKNSHKYGAMVFPHEIEIKNKKIFLKNEIFEEEVLIGKPGDFYVWHPYILHGTYPTHNGKPRVSLRILVERNADLDTKCLLCDVNKSLPNSKAQRVVRNVGKISPPSKLANIKDMLIAKYRENNLK